MVLIVTPLTSRVIQYNFAHFAMTTDLIDDVQVIELVEVQLAGYDEFGVATRHWPQTPATVGQNTFDKHFVLVAAVARQRREMKSVKRQ